MSVLAGAIAPARFQVTVENLSTDPAPLDLSTVTAVTLSVDKPGADLGETWSASIFSQTSTKLVVEHVFDTYGAEVEFPGDYLITVNMSTPGGPRRASASKLVVFP